MNLSLTLRMSPFLSASETMLVSFAMAVRTFSSASTSLQARGQAGALGLGGGLVGLLELHPAGKASSRAGPTAAMRGKGRSTTDAGGS